MDLNPKRPIRKLMILVIISLIGLVAGYIMWNLYSAPGVNENITKIDKTPVVYVYKPVVSIGCSRVVWNNSEVHLSASTNIRSAGFQWTVYNKTVGTEQNLVYTFEPGTNTLLLKAVSGNDTAQDDAEIIVVNSTDDISAQIVTGSMINERVLITEFKGVQYYIDGVSAVLDGKDMGTIPQCRQMVFSGLFAG
ncbi:Uncharacterised protein [uncultured archaeon]|nr:Uncharacterised protein [uncultured archaeon]